MKLTGAEGAVDVAEAEGLMSGRRKSSATVKVTITPAQPRTLSHLPKRPPVDIAFSDLTYAVTEGRKKREYRQPGQPPLSLCACAPTGHATVHWFKGKSRRSRPSRRAGDDAHPRTCRTAAAPRPTTASQRGQRRHAYVLPCAVTADVAIE